MFGRNTTSPGVHTPVPLFVWVWRFIQCAHNLIFESVPPSIHPSRSLLCLPGAGLDGQQETPEEIPVMSSKHDIYLSTGCNSQAVRVCYCLVFPGTLHPRWCSSQKWAFKARHELSVVFLVLRQVCSGYTECNILVMYPAAMKVREYVQSYFFLTGPGVMVYSISHGE